MAEVSDEVLGQLVAMGIIDEQMKIAPNAILPAVLRNPVNIQAQLLDMRLMCRRPLKDSSVERQMLSYLINRHGGHGDTSEGFWIKRFIAHFVEPFNDRKRTFNCSNNEAVTLASRLATITEEDVVRTYENDIYEDLSFPAAFHGSGVARLRERFRTKIVRDTPWIESPESRRSRVEDWETNEREKQYINQVREWLRLWNSLPNETWQELARVCLSEWTRMCTGWPDITFVNASGVLTLIEVKSTDKLHASQVYVLQKLKAVLGRERLALAWVNRNDLTRDQFYYERHIKDCNTWLSLDVEARGGHVFELPEWFSLRVAH